jgi:hypothetical protein
MVQYGKPLYSAMQCLIWWKESLFWRMHAGIVIFSPSGPVRYSHQFSIHLLPSFFVGDLVSNKHLTKLNQTLQNCHFGGPQYLTCMWFLLQWSFNIMHSVCLEYKISSFLKSKMASTAGQKFNTGHYREMIAYFFSESTNLIKYKLPCHFFVLIWNQRWPLLQYKLCTYWLIDWLSLNAQIDSVSAISRAR